MRKNPNDEESVEHAVGLFQEAVPIFSVLADANRQKILLELAINDRLNVSQLDERITLSRPAISHHLKALRVAGIVSSEKIGTENYYFLTLQNAVDLMKNLSAAIENSCFLK
jgi:ArsR family transcriptional regulator